MYTEKERIDLLNRILKEIDKSQNIIGTYLIGSSSIGFNDIYSDIDLMMVYRENIETNLIRDEILGFFNQEEIGFLMERKWTDTVWGISVYFKNGLSVDISFGPLKDLRIKSNQIKVGIDTDNLLKKYLEEGNEIFKNKYSNYNIDEKINWEFMYLIRNFLIAIKRNNLIYAYSVLNNARMLIMKIEGLNEGKKMHEFKAYNELDNDFQEKTVKTIPKNLDKEELNKCKDKLLELFYETVEKSDKIIFEEKSKYLLELAD